MSVWNPLQVCLLLLLLPILSSCQPASSNVPGFGKPSSQPADVHSAITTQPPTATAGPPSVQLRQAIAYCTDRSALIRATYPWVGETGPFEAISFLPPSHWAFADEDEGITRYPFSPEMGMTLLDSLGWKLTTGSQYRTNANGEKLMLTLTTTEVKFRQTWTAVWEEQMKTCGIHVVRKTESAQWLFGADTGLSHRDFDLAAFAISSSDEPGLVKSFLCDQIPIAGNKWQGQNFTGWCSPAVQNAVSRLVGTNDPAEHHSAYQTIQREFQKDLPILPLFYRASEFAINPALENFIPPDDGIHTWNAAQWLILGKDTIIIGTDSEPASLDEPAYISQVIRTLVTGRDVVAINGVFKPVFLSQNSLARKPAGSGTNGDCERG